MPLHLAHDADSNVETLPIGNLRDLGGMAELSLDSACGQASSATSTVVTLIAGPDGLSIHSWGELRAATR
jgi:hypothetical protein